MNNSFVFQEKHQSRITCQCSLQMLPLKQCLIKWYNQIICHIHFIKNVAERKVVAITSLELRANERIYSTLWFSLCLRAWCSRVKISVILYYFNLGKAVKAAYSTPGEYLVKGKDIQKERRINFYKGRRIAAEIRRNWNESICDDCIVLIF